MGKKKFKEKFKEKLDALAKADEELRRERKKIIIQCSHHNSKGKLKLEQLENGKWQCKYCHETFHMAPINQQELREAYQVLHDAIQQMRAFSDPEKDERLIVHLGEIDFNLGEILPTYDKIINFYSAKKGKKDKYKEEEIGFSGMGSLSFLDGKKKKKD